MVYGLVWTAVMTVMSGPIHQLSELAPVALLECRGFRFENVDSCRVAGPVLHGASLCCAVVATAWLLPWLGRRVEPLILSRIALFRRS
jgi:hypothetical protein